MASGVTITSDIRLFPARVASFAAGSRDMITRLSASPGFCSIRIVQHADDQARILIIEDWETEQALANWRARRSGAAAMAADVSSVITTSWARRIASAGRQDAIRDPDGTTVTFELKLHPQYVDVLTKREENFEVASRWAGFRSIRMLQHGDDPTRIIHLEQWDSETAYRSYLDWRTERGDTEGMKRIASLLEINTWPTVVAAS